MAVTADHQPKMWHKDLGQCVLCWLATVDGNGQPNVSPKEIWAVFDDQHLVIAHIASPVSFKNIQLNPKVCVSLIDIFVQKGWKLQGHAHYESASEPKFHNWANQLQAMVGEKIKLEGVILAKAISMVRAVACIGSHVGRVAFAPTDGNHHDQHLLVTNFIHQAKTQSL